MSDLGPALDALYAVLEERKHADASSSYVASLNAKGLDAILKKVAEEAAETMLAAKNGERQALVHESVDLLFHLMVLMARQGISCDDLAGEIYRRSGRSGLEEKAARGK